MAVKRQANFELLRIVAMGMIIILHYLNRGSILAPYGEGTDVINYAAWMIEALCVVSVNCYVLISGYFLAESEWKPERIVSLVMQVLFYSILIPAAMLCLGMLSGSELSVYDWLIFIFPFQTEHYWFATHYLLLYLFAPILAAGVQKLEKRTLQIIILILLLFFSIGKTLIPFDLVTDTDGYHYGWFLCLFLVAAYIRKYGILWLEKERHSIILYVGMCILTWLISALCGVIEQRTGAFSHYVNMSYTYNYFFVLLASIGLFYAFKNMQMQEGKATRLICKTAPYTFGIYLLHEHILVRDKWMFWLGVEKVQGTWAFIPHMIFCVLIIYLIGMIIDFVRAYLFAKAVRFIGKRKLTESGRQDER